MLPTAGGSNRWCYVGVLHGECGASGGASALCAVRLYTVHAAAIALVPGSPSASPAILASFYYGLVIESQPCIGLQSTARFLHRLQILEGVRTTDFV